MTFAELSELRIGDLLSAAEPGRRVWVGLLMEVDRQPRQRSFVKLRPKGPHPGRDDSPRWVDAAYCRKAEGFPHAQ